MGKPMKIERIGDMFQLLWLESVITEASLMTRNIKLPSVFMNWMCFHCRSGGALPPQPKHRGVWGAPAKNRNVIKKPFLEKALSRKVFNSMIKFQSAVSVLRRG